MELGNNQKKKEKELRKKSRIFLVGLV